MVFQNFQAQYSRNSLWFFRIQRQYNWYLIPRNFAEIPGNKIPQKFYMIIQEFQAISTLGIPHDTPEMPAIEPQEFRLIL